ncbi:hypothetical protein PFICI_02648 [Pestalotiopsis fici W106-1]|uniref:Heterokaryon incompatibility domain-containing protein n=1 Tax=Pestalotiopsis fici (strain W106-1 / CGMCC3.15140) TaxID=1229662 RepID=W3XEU7_PESFW|nr:uncharacterized protein PFICI_02648 [Pestalotiopsis fici W106-1]ETS84623.1 hypothetical protein PFICI_02648 [Pestalotiopsis fici W106-1]
MVVRWHASTCTDPVVSVKDSEVSCQNCSATYLFNQRSVPQTTAAGPAIPQDRPLGRLRWPPSVPYTTDEDLDISHSTTATIPDTDKAPVSSEPTSENTGHSRIYRQLDVGQFRLICLYPAENHGDLIHLDLEQYNLDDCPEYEATSYAWGGEDGDSKPSGPIFIGNFYDVALQTKNCLSMLKYLRPTRGVRMVWIDAICIDQSNIREREVQVAEMQNIYRNASRVVVYLGPDTVLQPTQQHRRRSWLDESQAFEDNDDRTSKKLMDHRYFSRVWVIQELLLAKSLLIPLYSSEYYADSACIKRLSIDWNSTTAPWFEHIASGRIFSRNELHLLLDQTWSSEATDPRDKLFGILGLVDTAVCDQEPRSTADSCRNVDYSLLPDYTLSTREIFIGLVAYVMIILDQRHALGHAAGLKAAPGYPTWLPDMRDPFIWRSQIDAAQRDYDQLQDWYRVMGLCCQQVWSITSDFQGDFDWWRSKSTDNQYQLWNTTSFAELRAMMSLGNSTNESLSIHSSTAALSIKLIRIIQLSSRPRRIADFGSLRLFEFVMAKHSLLLCTDLIDLDLLLGDIPIWIFMRDTDGAIGPILFFLRESQQKVRGVAYELVCSCRCWNLLIFRRPQLPVSSDAAGADLPEGKGADGQSTGTLLNDNIQIKHAEDCFYDSRPILSLSNGWTMPLPYETLYSAASIIKLDSQLDEGLLGAIPDGNLRVKDILPLFQLLTDAPSLYKINYHQFGELYVSIMSQFSTIHCSTKSPCDIDYRRLGDENLANNIPQDTENIFFTFDAAMWAEYTRILSIGRRTRMYNFDVFVNQKVTKVIEVSAESSPECFTFEGHDIIYRKRVGEKPMRNWMGWSLLGAYGIEQKIYSSASVNDQATVYICIPVKRIATHMFLHHLRNRLCDLTKFRTFTGQDETTMALNFKEEYRNIFAHNWPDSLREEIGLIGEPCRVQIL